MENVVSKIFTMIINRNSVYLIQIQTVYNLIQNINVNNVSKVIHQVIFMLKLSTAMLIYMVNNIFKMNFISKYV